MHHAVGVSTRKRRAAITYRRLRANRPPALCRMLDAKYSIQQQARGSQELPDRSHSMGRHWAVTGQQPVPSSVAAAVVAPVGSSSGSSKRSSCKHCTSRFSRNGSSDATSTSCIVGAQCVEPVRALCCRQ